jgi:hypothetical protein
MQIRKRLAAGVRRQEIWRGQPIKVAKAAVRTRKIDERIFRDRRLTATETSITFRLPRTGSGREKHDDSHESGCGCLSVLFDK